MDIRIHAIVCRLVLFDELSVQNDENQGFLGIGNEYRVETRIKEKESKKGREKKKAIEVGNFKFLVIILEFINKGGGARHR